VTQNRERQRRGILVLAALLPGFLHMVQHKLTGNEEQAAFSLIGALPPGGDMTLFQQYRHGLEWAAAVYGMDELRRVAAEPREFPAGAEKAAELATLFDRDDAESRITAVLDKLQRDHTPTDCDVRILTAAKNLYGDATQ
jgi:hypothetical protein